MKKLLFHCSLSLSIYLGIYLIIVFCQWTWLNPFEWVIRLPVLEEGQRFSILTGMFFYQLLIGFVTKAFFEHEGPIQLKHYDGIKRRLKKLPKTITDDEFRAALLKEYDFYLK